MFQARQLISESERSGAHGTALADKSIVSQFTRKWAPLTEGIEHEIGPLCAPGHANYVRAICSMMMEQQSAHLQRLSEETRAMSVGPFLKYILPVIRRTAIRLVATQIASVQPMTGPIGGIAFYRPKYGSNKGRVRKGDEVNKVFNKWYSSNFVDGEPFGTGDGGNVNFSRQLDWARPLPNQVTIKVAGVTVGTDNGSGGLTNLSGALAGGAGAVDYDTGQMSLTFGTAPLAGQAITIEYRYDNELNARIPEMQIDIEIKSIEAESRKLKSLASVEAADDLRSMWGRDVDADLVAQMSDAMTAEIDREIAGTAFAAVEPIARVPWDRATPSGVSDPEHLKSLIVRLSRASHIIHRRTQRSAANWIITSSEVAALLDTMEEFTAVDEGHVYQGGIVKGGVLNRKFIVYVDPEFPSDKILMGYQGPSILDTGLIYSPYIPMEITPNFVDPNDWSIRRAVRTRHKVTMIRPEFFAMVEVSNLT